MINNMTWAERRAALEPNPDVFYARVVTLGDLLELPYKVEISNERGDSFRGSILEDDQINWLESEVGKKEVDWIWLFVSRTGPSEKGQWRVEFKREEDKVKFILRWL